MGKANSALSHTIHAFHVLRCLNAGKRPNSSGSVKDWMMLSLSFFLIPFFLNAILFCQVVRQALCGLRPALDADHFEIFSHVSCEPRPLCDDRVRPAFAHQAL